MTDGLWLFAAMLSGSLGFRLWRFASEHLDDWELGRAFLGWVLGSALFALAVWFAL